MSRTALLTLGRLPKCLDIARALHGAGWRVLVAEPGRWHLTGSSRAVARAYKVPSPVGDEVGYVDALADICAREGVELVVPVSEEALYASALHGRLPDGARVFSPPRERLLALHDKLRFTQRCAELGLPAPEGARLDEPEAAALAASGPVMVKRIYSCSGVGLARVPTGQPLPLQSEPAAWLVQRELAGPVFSSFSIAHEGRVIGTVVYRGTVMSGTVAVCFERVSDTAPFDAFIEPFVRAENWSGFIAFDFILGEDGVARAIECNPRATSGIHFVEPGSLAAAITDPAGTSTLALRAQRLMQQFYPCLTETQGAMLRRDGFREKLGQLVRATDVTWRLTDPLPFVLMPATSAKILSLTLFGGMSFGEAATHDIEWQGEAPMQVEPVS